VVAKAPGYGPVEAVVDVPADGSGVVHDFVLQLEEGGGDQPADTDAAASSGTTADGENVADTAGSGPTTTSSSSSSSSGGSKPASVTSSAGADAASKLRASVYILSVHAAVFVALSGASLCQSSGALHALIGARLKRLGSHSRFEV